MIVFDLSCANGHQFEGWFGSGDDFTAQKQRGLLACPQCGSQEVIKAPMAPAVGRKGNQQTGGHALSAAQPVSPGAPDQAMANTPMPPEVQQALRKLAEAQAKALKNSTWVGRDFADQSRAMHYGERETQPIHGEASIEQARSLIDEGIEVAPLPFRVAPPEDLN